MGAFSAIIGHSSQIAALQQDIAENNVSHAYLFVGPVHIGKRTIAKQFATELLCSGVSTDAQDSCAKQVSRLLHADFFALDMLYIDVEQSDWAEIGRYSNVGQQHRAKKKVKTDTISIDDVRMLQEHLHEKPAGNYRVCFIRNIERMTTAAANAFLKILEEPPSQLVFILTTESSGALLETVVSRARVLRFSRVATKELVPLVESLSPEDQQFAIDLSQGAPGILLQLTEDPERLALHKTWHAQSIKIWNTTSFKTCMQNIQPVLKRSPEATEFLLHLALALRVQPYKKWQHDAYNNLVRALQTNANRSFIVNQFALGIQSNSAV